jgi:dolichol-phosphate mannosyltransferase
MDADFSHHPRHFADLLKATEKNDFSLGSRYVLGGEIVDWSWWRKCISYVANFFVRLWLGINVNDCTSGFRCFRREVLENIGLETITSKGYLFQVEVLYRCVQQGYAFQETPITYVERKQSKTKFGFLEIWEAFWGVLRLKFSKRIPGKSIYKEERVPVEVK